jgi:hypothetical protein
MGLQYVSHAELAYFAKEKVNLQQDKANQYREQAKRLQNKLQNYVDANPNFELKRMITSGSLAKGTALKQLNDIDVGCYITGVTTSTDIPYLIGFLTEKLRKAFPNFKPEQVKPQTHSVSVSFRGTGLDVDIVPIIYDGNKEWDGHLINRHDGSFLMTNIPKHLEFIRKRKSENKKHFSQVVRLAKFWAKRLKKEQEGFRFKSFMIELIFAKLADDGMNVSNYVEALQGFFTYLATSNIEELIAFTDYYQASALVHYPDRVKMIDPVNPENNAAKLYSNSEANAIVEAALEAGDAIDAAIYATTKEKTVYYWQKVFGNSFNI